MKSNLNHILLSFIFIIASFIAANAQDIIGAQMLVQEGVVLHDQGLYDEAMQKYDSALTIDPENVGAMGERALTLMEMQKYADAADACRAIVKKYPRSRDLEFVYTTYGNSLDALGKSSEALEVYDEGISKFPEYSHLYFNKGITLALLERFDDAQKVLEEAILLNPYHPGSQNALARVLVANNKEIPSLLAFLRFFIIEPEGPRAVANLPYVKDILKANVEVTGKNSITVNMSPIEVSEEDNGEKKPNDFRMVSIMLSMSAALDYDKKNKRKSEPELVKSKLETMCTTLSEMKKDNYGFYWKQYVPYFVALNNAGHSETLAYIVYASQDDKKIGKWIEANREKIDAFYNWDKDYEW